MWVTAITTLLLILILDCATIFLNFSIHSFVVELLAYLYIP
jgi:hypothetical protein